ncbi:MAG: hypothetical protein GY862_35145 [Gammaproteobacteria bacterium]|nr:hypothetical protein [Gammaproteobacteria bacterium]
MQDFAACVNGFGVKSPAVKKSHGFIKNISGRDKMPGCAVQGLPMFHGNGMVLVTLQFLIMMQ